MAGRCPACTGPHNGTWGQGGAGHLHCGRVLELMVCLFTVAGSGPLPQGLRLTQLGQQQDPDKETVWSWQGLTGATMGCCWRRLPGTMLPVPSPEPITAPGVWPTTVPHRLSLGLDGAPVCPVLSLLQHPWAPVLSPVSFRKPFSGHPGGVETEALSRGWLVPAVGD